MLYRVRVQGIIRRFLEMMLNSDQGTLNLPPWKNHDAEAIATLVLHAAVATDPLSENIVVGGDWSSGWSLLDDFS